MNELIKSELKISGFDTQVELLEHQVKEYQIFMREQTVRIEELEEMLKEALNGTLLKRYNQEKEDALEKLKVAVEALVRISEIGYYHDYGDHRQVASKALEKIKGEK